MADQEHYSDPFSAVVGVIDNYRNQQRQLEDADLERKISMLHSIINAPNANPAHIAEGLKGILELQSAKGGRGKRQKGVGGFLGKTEHVMPDLLAQIIHGGIPMQGPTQQAVPRPASPMEQGLMPKAAPIPPMGGPSLHDFDGSTILQAPPIQVPPEPFQSQPSGDRMLSAARDMQKYNEGPKFTQLPQNQQPMFISPEEMAQREGTAAGIKTGATRTATHESDVKYWKSIGMSDQEIAQMVKTQAMGAGANLQVQDAGYFEVDGKLMHAIRTLNPRTGMWDTVEETSGMPIPPGSVVKPAPSSALDKGTPDLQEYNAVVADEKARNGWSQTEMEGTDAFLTKNANRKAGVASSRNAQGFTGPQQFAAQVKLQGMWNKESTAYSTMINQYNQMQAGMQAADQGLMNPASQAVLVTFQKILDPSSVVRESEYARSPDGLGLIERVRGWAQKLSQGGAGVPPEELKQFATTARMLIKNMENSLNAQRAQITSSAAIAGLAPERIFGSATGLPPITGEQPQAVVTPNIPTPPGTPQATAAPGNIPTAPGAKGPIDSAMVQKYATEHGVDTATAAKVFTDAGYTVAGSTPAQADVKKK